MCLRTEAGQVQAYLFAGGLMNYTNAASRSCIRPVTGLISGVMNRAGLIAGSGCHGVSNSFVISVPGAAVNKL